MEFVIVGTLILDWMGFMLIFSSLFPAVNPASGTSDRART